MIFPIGLFANAQVGQLLPACQFAPHGPICGACGKKYFRLLFVRLTSALLLSSWRLNSCNANLNSSIGAALQPFMP